MCQCPTCHAVNAGDYSPLSVLSKTRRQARAVRGDNQRPQQYLPWDQSLATEKGVKNLVSLSRSAATGDANIAFIKNLQKTYGVNAMAFNYVVYII